MEDKVGQSWAFSDQSDYYVPNRFGIFRIVHPHLWTGSEVDRRDSGVVSQCSQDFAHHIQP